MVRALVRFLTPEEGGRSRPFEGTRYVTVGHFQHVQDSWSIVVEFATPPATGDLVSANIRPLSPEAPADLLSRGTSFSLLEGRRTTAECLVYQDDRPVDYDIDVVKQPALPMRHLHV